jgi:hypothetical protein
MIHLASEISLYALSATRSKAEELASIGESRISTFLAGRKLLIV